MLRKVNSSIFFRNVNIKGELLTKTLRPLWNSNNLQSYRGIKKISCLFVWMHVIPINLQSYSDLFRFFQTWPLKQDEDH